MKPYEIQVKAVDKEGPQYQMTARFLWVLDINDNTFYQLEDPSLCTVIAFISLSNCDCGVSV